MAENRNFRKVSSASAKDPSTRTKAGTMTTASYKIVRNGKNWAVNHDGVLEGDYATKEVAYELAALAGSNAIKAGYGVAITVEPREAGEAALG